MMLRLTISASLIFLTNFRQYIFFVVPSTCIPMLVIAKMTADAYKGEDKSENEGGCEPIVNAE